MDQLKEALKGAFSDSFSFYMKAHGYHWNVEGVLFSQFHDFFGSIYQEVHGDIDAFAEQIRTLDTYAPFTFQQFHDYTTITGSVDSPDPLVMTRDLLDSNNLVITSLSGAFKLANELNKQGIADFLAARINAHEKHGWMLRSHLK